MKKNIVIAVLALTTVLSLMYGFVQKTEADKQRQLSAENMKRAQAAQDLAERAQKVAEGQAAVSQKAMADALASTQRERARAEKVLEKAKK
jgi:hypothetical protein